MRLLFIGDIFGRPGREAVVDWLPAYRHQAGVNFVVANAENAAGGKGINPQIVTELSGAGCDVLTGGNHSFAQREGMPLFDNNPRVLRPANLPPRTPGRGYNLYTTYNELKVAVINLQGRAFMKAIDCPYRKADKILEQLNNKVQIILVDFHAEATSEKVAMAYHLEGRVSAVVGTHTHIPTADARILAGGTAAITDVGMSGPFDSVIGVEKELILDQLIRMMPVRHSVAKGDVRICAVQIDIDDKTGRAQAIQQIMHPDWRRTS